ncbi:SRPBCC family protein [Snuella lapsa]|uniref:Cell division protein n=1 Tax=Snuella lapsa TaxID=870481 RepID=A0ABP6WRE0_9FLAO
MPIIQIKTEINSDIKTCFDLARNIDLHQDSLKHYNEKAIAGKVTGLIELGEWVSWEAKHLGFVQHLTSKIVEFDSPNYFIGEMIFGAFKSFRHEYHFYENENKTLVVGKFYFESPYGILGKLANVLFLRRYMKKLLLTRSCFLKERAELT